MRYIPLIRSVSGVNENGLPWGAGLRWRPLPQAEAPTEPTGETSPYDVRCLKTVRITEQKFIFQ